MWLEIRRHARRTLRAAAVLMCTAGAIPFWGFAQYPEKPITLLVGYGAGSAGDQIARGLAAAASKRLRQPILVVNRSSASGTHAIALGVFYDHRLKLGMSGVPTFKERGFEILLTTGQAVVAPHGTPASNVRILDEMVRKAVAEPSFVSLAERTQNTIDYKGPEEFAADLRREFEKNGELLRALRITKK